MPGPSPSSTGNVAVVVGFFLAMVAFKLADGQLWEGVWLVGLVVPIGVRTYVRLTEARAQGKSILLESVPALVNSSCYVLALAFWVVVVGLVVAVVKTSPMGLVLIFWMLVALLLSEFALVSNRRTAGADRRWSVRSLLTIRGMLLVVALVALVLWPVHLWQKWDRQRGSGGAHPFRMDEVCQAEAEIMAARARECLRRDREKLPWSPNDPDVEGLKCSPYPNDPTCRSWSDQAQVWENAATRALRAAARY